MNILILSAGTRNKVVQYFKEELGDLGNIICTDMSEYAPAIYEGDKYYITPPIKDENYIENLLEICKKEKVDAMISLIDPELSLLAKNKKAFEEIGVKLVQSNPLLINKSFDKWEFYNEVISKGFKSQLSFTDYVELQNLLERKIMNFPVFVKPINGSASLNINKIDNSETLNQILENNKNLIIQEYIDGKEYGIDVYVDLISEKVVSIFIKEKIKMRSGETDKSISIKNDKIFDLIKNFVEEMGYVGPIDIDLFEKDGDYYISEVNPRFGGGYPHAYMAGCNFPKYILNNIKGKLNDINIGNYEEGNVMMKFNEIMFMEGNKNE